MKAGASVSNITSYLGYGIAFRIGELGVAAIPFETFAEMGLEVKSKSPFNPTFTMDLANGGYGLHLNNLKWVDAQPD